MAHRKELNCKYSLFLRLLELLGSGNYAGSESLQAGGKYVNSNIASGDHPFILTKESIISFVFIKAENLNQAVSIAQTCPLLLNNIMSIKVRPIVVLEEKLNE